MIVDKTIYVQVLINEHHSSVCIEMSPSTCSAPLDDPDLPPLSGCGGVGGSCCVVWLGEGCCADGGEGERCAAACFFDRTEALKWPHFGQTYSV